MVKTKSGALPSQEIRELIKNKHVVNGVVSQVQPASLDLTLGNKIYRLPSVFLPHPGERIKDVAKDIGAEPYSFNYPLERNVPYLVKLREDFDLPKDVYAYASPKSSTGRLGLHVALLADGIPRFDSAGIRGYKGSLWAVIRPEIFRVKLTPGVTLLQTRFFYSDTRLRHNELGTFFKEHNPLYFGKKPIKLEDIKISDSDGGLITTVDLSSDAPGWRSEGSEIVLDVTKKGFYNPSDFFTPIPKPRHGRITLRRGDFYILATKERIRVPEDFSAEVMPVDIRSGEYRSHYAGFFDPGWGEDKGAQGVLEVRTFEDDLLLRDGQPIAKFIFERVNARPDILYGKGIGSTYHLQTGPRLSKHFKLPS